MIPVALTPGMEGSLEDPLSLDLGNANVPIPLPGASHGFGGNTLHTQGSRGRIAQTFDNNQRCYNIPQKLNCSYLVPCEYPPSQILRLFLIFLITKSLRIFSKAWAVLYLAMLVGL